ncbi:hypothetical protein FACS1894125_2500 [Actinomycetota bacterium]|nr:hypothetical protein FACS1894125_2500 [Actinomycetota bacterium]
MADNQWSNINQNGGVPSFSDSDVPSFGEQSFSQPISDPFGGQNFTQQPTSSFGSTNTAFQGGGAGFSQFGNALPGVSKTAGGVTKGKIAAIVIAAVVGVSGAGTGITYGITGESPLQLIAPTKTVEQFCKAETKGLEDIKKVGEDLQQSTNNLANNTSDDSLAVGLSGLVSAIGGTTQLLEEMTDMYKQMNRHAPSDIAEDMQEVYDSQKEQIEKGVKNGVDTGVGAISNPLGALTEGIGGVLGSGMGNKILHGKAYDNVESYSKEKCGVGAITLTEK